MSTWKRRSALALRLWKLRWLSMFSCGARKVKSCAPRTAGGRREEWKKGVEGQVRARQGQVRAQETDRKGQERAHERDRKGRVQGRGDCGGDVTCMPRTEYMKTMSARSEATLRSDGKESTTVTTRSRSPLAPLSSRRMRSTRNSRSTRSTDGGSGKARGMPKRVRPAVSSSSRSDAATSTKSKRHQPGRSAQARSEGGRWEGGDRKELGG